MNKLLIPFMFSMLFSFASKGQDQDSLVLIEISKAKNLIESDVAAALQLANNAFINSRELDFDRGIAESYLVVGRCYIQTGDLEAQRALHIALKYAEIVQDKTLISDCYFYLGKSCFINGDTKSQLAWYEKAFAIRKVLNDQKRLADSYHAYGNVYLTLEQDSLAESYFILSKNIRTKLNDVNGLAAICNNLGLIADHRGDIALYRKLMFEAIRMNEQTGNKRYLATNHGNLGVSYLKEKNYDSAWYHCYLAFEIRKNNDFKDHLSGSYNDLGKILFAQKKYVEALTYYKRGADLAQSISGTEWMIGSYFSIAETYAALDSPELSLKYKEMAEKLTKEHEADTLLSKKIPLPPAFDFAEPRSKPIWFVWAGGVTVLLCLAGFVLYRMRK